MPAPKQWKEFQDKAWRQHRCTRRVFRFPAELQANARIFKLSAQSTQANKRGRILNDVRFMSQNWIQ